MIYETLRTEAGSDLLISMLEKLNWFHLTSLITLVLLMWKWMALILRKNHVLRCWGWLSVLNWMGALTLSLTLSLSPEIALYLYKSNMWPCMEYCCNAWNGVPSCYLQLLDKVQKRICRTVGLEPLAHCQNVASWSLLYRHYFNRCSSELAHLVSLPYSRGRSSSYSDRLPDFCVTIPRCYKDVYVNSFFPYTARLWKFLPIECFPLTFGLNGWKSRITGHLLTVGSV